MVGMRVINADDIEVAIAPFLLGDQHIFGIDRIAAGGVERVGFAGSPNVGGGTNFDHNFAIAVMLTEEKAAAFLGIDVFGVGFDLLEVVGIEGEAHEECDRDDLQIPSGRATGG